MNTHLTAALVAGALAGAAAATLAFVIAGPGGDAPREAPAPRGVASPSADTTAELDELRRSVEDLRSLNEQLAVRLAAVESRPQAPARVPVDSEEPELQAGVLPGIDARRLQEVLAANSGGELPPAFIESVGSAVEQLREEERREREERRRLAAEERRERRLVDLTEELQLDSYQVGEMRKVLTTLDEQRAELFATARETGDPRTIRETMRTIAQDARDTLSNVLTPEQLAGYDRSAGTFRFGGGRRRDDGDAGGDPPAPLRERP